uniref:Uncharacterized protein n=1 Tax=Salvator merianae TaxID=96440 RepID=A0A8D0CBP6_SALMN
MGCLPCFGELSKSKHPSHINVSVIPSHKRSLFVGPLGLCTVAAGRGKPHPATCCDSMVARRACKQRVLVFPKLQTSSLKASGRCCCFIHTIAHRWYIDIEGGGSSSKVA